jgi:hypothetical protein
VAWFAAMKWMMFCLYDECGLMSSGKEAVDSSSSRQLTAAMPLYLFVQH